MKENSEIQEDLGNGGKVKNWLQDNIRVILSVLIVATIMAGIYSYSKRTVVPAGDMESGTEINLAEADVEKEDNDNAVVVVGEDSEENKVEQVEENSSKKLSVEQVDNEGEQVQAEEARQAEEAKKAEEARQAEEAKKAEEARQVEEAKKAEETKPQENFSEETSASFDETAEAGDSLTTLARRATKHYLEKNPTEGLSAEHKIYIEDYLRKQINHSSNVNLGEKVSFSKNSISQAVSMAKNLNEGQLKNLQQYSVLVSGL